MNYPCFIYKLNSLSKLTMKILHICENIRIKSGGSVVIKRNLKVIKDFFGEENTIQYELSRKSSNKIKNLWDDITELGFYGLNKQSKEEILNIIQQNKINIVFLDSSNLGVLAKIIKQRYKLVKVVTFFHNIEFIFFKEEFKITYSFKYLYKAPLSYLNEKFSCKYSDIVITLNNRDSNMLYKYYKRTADKIIPVSLINDKIANYYNSEKYLLFVGSNFPPNIKGISFFIEKILPHIKIKLVIAGSGMETLKEKYKTHKNLEVFGYVEDLTTLYANANLVVLPIFAGSGMKIKTAEALKYGKYIIAAPEALTGYPYNKDIAICCKDAKSFISAINNFDFNQSKFNQESRNLFLQKYTHEIAYQTFCEVFKSIK